VTKRKSRLAKIAPRRLRAPLSRSEIMGRIRSKDTVPEIRTRSAVHALGRRFRVHAPDLPGKPDLVNRSKRWAIFVHGCFWHSHDGCRLASSPRSNKTYWAEKLTRTQSRDLAHETALRALGFEVLTVWECESRDDGRLREVVGQFFGSLEGGPVPSPKKAHQNDRSHR
jgi:DNA mismatch endonuclease (patch repair protein)